VHNGLALAGGSYVFFEKLLQRRRFQYLVGEQLLQLGVLILKRLKALGVGDVHAAVLRLPVIDRRLRDRVLAREVGWLGPASCSRSTAMICSSVNRFRFIRPSLDRAGL